MASGRSIGRRGAAARPAADAAGLSAATPAAATASASTPRAVSLSAGPRLVPPGLRMFLRLLTARKVSIL
jgi:hypothetical protein